MNLDVIGATAVGIGIVLIPTLLAVKAQKKGRTLALMLGGWALAVATLAIAGIFSYPGGIGTPAIVAACVGLIAAGLLSSGTAIGRAVRAVSLPVLTGLQTIRVFGILFVLLTWQGRASGPFGPIAGWGDVFIGATAPLMAWLAARRPQDSSALLRVWNGLGLLDLVVAVLLGVASAPGSPLRIFTGDPGTHVMGTYPWVLVPTFLVPTLALLHLASLSALPRGQVASPAPA